MTRAELRAELERVTLEIERGPIVLQQIAQQQERVAITLQRLEGRADLLRELLAAGDSESAAEAE